MNVPSKLPENAVFSSRQPKLPENVKNPTFQQNCNFSEIGEQNRGEKTAKGFIKTANFTKTANFMKNIETT